jgi:hypothetical protein
VTIQDVIDLIAHELKTTPRSFDESILSLYEVQQSFKQLTSWEWLWGETPAFEMSNGIKVRKGIVEEPIQGRFEKEFMRNLIDANELEKIFADFTEQNKAREEVF